MIRDKENGDFFQPGRLYFEEKIIHYYKVDITRKIDV